MIKASFNGKTANWMTRGAQYCMVLKLGHFGNQIRNSWKIVKCGAGEGWRRSAGPIV
jgi:hypothetical protein